MLLMLKNAPTAALAKMHARQMQLSAEQYHQLIQNGSHPESRVTPVFYYRQASMASLMRGHARPPAILTAARISGAENKDFKFFRPDRIGHRFSGEPCYFSKAT
jgi:hypothetical protein